MREGEQRARTAAVEPSSSSPTSPLGQRSFIRCSQTLTLRTRPWWNYLHGPLKCLDVPLRAPVADLALLLLTTDLEAPDDTHLSAPLCGWSSDWQPMCVRRTDSGVSGASPWTFRLTASRYLYRFLLHLCSLNLNDVLLDGIPSRDSVHA